MLLYSRQPWNIIINKINGRWVMETKTDQSLRMLHGRQHSPSSKILHFHLCQDHPCPT